MGDAVCLKKLYLDLARETKQHLEGVNEVLECSLCLSLLKGSDILLNMIEDILFVSLITLLTSTLVSFLIFRD
jgi:hypothetical protein